MKIYISAAREDLTIARQIADLLPRYLTDADGGDGGDSAIFLPSDDDEREARLAESQFIALLLSPAALRSPGVQRDIEQMRRLRAEDALKFFITVVLQPVSLDEDLAQLRSVDAVARPIEEVAEEVAYYATWRPRFTGARIYFAPPPPPTRSAPITGAPAPQPPAAEPLPEWDDEDFGAVRGSPFPPPLPAPPPAPAPQPQSQPGQPDLPKQARGATTETPSDARTLQFSAYYPNTIAVETWNTLLVYTYVAEALAQIQADAGTFSELGSAPAIAKGESTRAVARGAELTIEPHMEGVTFSPARDSFVWREDWRRSLFRFSGAATLAGHEQRGWIDIYAGPMVPIARIDFRFPFRAGGEQQLATNPPRGMMITSNIHDAVFISYSHRDREAFRQACDEYRRFGVTIYNDEQLAAGVNYERELARMIVEANVFHLLWSPRSAGSPECRKEWLLALQREPTERFIKPWFWKQPLSPPPTEFVHYRISFKYEPLKRSLWRPETWF